MPSASGVSETAACPPSPTAVILQVYHLPPLLPPPCSNSSFLFTKCQPLYASCTVLLNFLRCCNVRLKVVSLFFGFFLMHYLCEKYYKNSLGAQTVKNLPAVQQTWVQSLGQDDPLEKEKATHFSILTWEIP